MCHNLQKRPSQKGGQEVTASACTPLGTLQEAQAKPLRELVGDASQYTRENQVETGFTYAVPERRPTSPLLKGNCESITLPTTSRAGSLHTHPGHFPMCLQSLPDWMVALTHLDQESMVVCPEDDQMFVQPYPTLPSKLVQARNEWTAFAKEYEARRATYNFEKANLDRVLANYAKSATPVVGYNEIVQKLMNHLAKVTELWHKAWAESDARTRRFMEAWNGYHLNLTEYLLGTADLRPFPAPTYPEFPRLAPAAQLPAKPILAPVVQASEERRLAAARAARKKRMYG
jgi:hypothetical protein